MKIAVTGATGFVGRYISRRLLEAGHELRCWYRPSSSASRFDGPEWVVGDLSQSEQNSFLSGCDALVHAALFHAANDWSGGSNLEEFLQINFFGSIRLFEAALTNKLSKVIFVSTCAVYDAILPDRPLDEFHPLMPNRHYGAHKAALEAFAHSYARGKNLDIAVIRPTGVYGLAEPAVDSKWYELVKAVAAGKEVTCRGGGKEVHADDVARAICLLLESSATRGQIYNCYDRYVSDWDVIHFAKEISGSRPTILGQQSAPKNQISSETLKKLGLTFGGEHLLRLTIEQLLSN